VEGGLWSLEEQGDRTPARDRVWRAELRHREAASRNREWGLGRAEGTWATAALVGIEFLGWIDETLESEAYIPLVK
jgi:hypothetical protein